MGMSLGKSGCQNLAISTRREWLLPTGTGGYAMGTVSGINTRRYHGLLVANTPRGRQVLLAAVDASVQLEAEILDLSANQYPGTIHPRGYSHLQSFSCGEDARWRFEEGAMRVEKRLRMHPGRDACTLEYENLGEMPILVTLRPLVSHKPFHENFSERESYPHELSFPKGRTEIEHGGVRLHLSHPGAQRVPVQGWYYRFEHQREIERGLNSRDDLFCPCEIRYELFPGDIARLVASTEPDEAPMPFRQASAMEASSPIETLREGAGAFLVRKNGRLGLLAGYPWFSEWGRDAMISIPGLCLWTGRIAEAREILRGYTAKMDEGLIPNRFAEGDDAPHYNTVDATLWFANAVYETLEAEWEPEFAAEMHDALTEVFDHHVRGTKYGIQMDPEDALLTQGETGVQLTWMDAKVGDWVVTPRYGKPVEVNGLWINFLRVLERLSERLGRPSERAAELAARAETGFQKFWHEVRGHYLDTVHPTDASLRPNQLIAMALPFGPAKGERAVRAFDRVTRELLTPRGLRTLSPRESHYRGRFQGPLPELDAAYHQGTVWPWLLGSYVGALLRLKGDRIRAREILEKAMESLGEYGLGGISECYDGDPPHEPGGCPWQAWSVAEVLRAWCEWERSEPIAESSVKGREEGDR